MGIPAVRVQRSHRGPLTRCPLRGHSVPGASATPASVRTATVPRTISIFFRAAALKRRRYVLSQVTCSHASKGVCVKGMPTGGQEAAEPVLLDRGTVSAHLRPRPGGVRASVERLPGSTAIPASRAASRGRSADGCPGSCGRRVRHGSRQHLVSAGRNLIATGKAFAMTRRPNRAVPDRPTNSSGNSSCWECSARQSPA